MDSIIINKLRFNVEKNLQDFVQFTMRKLLSTNSIPDVELENLQNFEYCKSTFGLKFPLLSTEKNAYANDDKHHRYYSKETFFEKGFYLCNDWYPEKSERLFSVWLRMLAKQ